ncbi:heat-shock protein Hsp20 [Halobacteriales archaeon QH_10_70_21]|nr:MAG: heat-shock protein Hsp20 [Halobacteriales archaeon QH_10_70_21]
MIREVGESLGRVVLDGIGRASSRVQEHKPLSADLLEGDEAYLAVFDAPGARAADVDVRFEENTLTVRVDRFRELHEDYEMRFPGRGLSLEGSVTLPETADVEAGRAEATLTERGALEVLIPKSEPDEAVTAADTVSADEGASDGASADA